MRNTVRKLWLIPVGALCLMANSSAAEQASDSKRPVLQSAPVSLQQKTINPPSVTVLGSRQAQSVLGKEVRTSADESMGRIVDIVVDREGRVRAAVIDFGGFLGVGSRKIAIDWSALRFDLDGAKRDLVTLELTRDQVKAAPEYKDKQAVVVLGAAGGLQSLPNW
ncbi:MAG: PRC-barrel domain-containing protein [Xanthobacteraceae bacterium]